MEKYFILIQEICLPTLSNPGILSLSSDEVAYQGGLKNALWKSLEKMLSSVI